MVGFGVKFNVRIRFNLMVRLMALFGVRCWLRVRVRFWLSGR